MKLAALRGSAADGHAVANPVVQLNRGGEHTVGAATDGLEFGRVRRCAGLRILAVLLIAAVAVQSARSEEHTQEQSSEYSVEELVAAVTEQLTSIESLYCEYSWQFANSPRPTRCRYARSGSKWHYAELSFDAERKADKENIYCFDGNLVYASVVRNPQGKDPQWGSVHLQDAREQESPDPDSLLGAKLSNVNRSLPQVFALVDVTKLDASLSDGPPGFQLRALAVPTSRTGPEIMKYDVSVTLDAVHDLLPREIRITESEETGTSPEWAQHWIINEFRRIRDERTDRERWFPVSGTFEQGKTGAPAMTMVVDQVRINPILPETLFRPEIPDGVTLADTTSTGHGKMAYKGREFLQDADINGLANGAREALGKGSAWTWWIIVANLVLVGVLLRWYGSRRWLSRP